MKASEEFIQAVNKVALQAETIAQQKHVSVMNVVDDAHCDDPNSVENGTTSRTRERAAAAMSQQLLSVAADFPKIDGASHSYPGRQIPETRAGWLRSMVGSTEVEIDFLWSVVAHAVDARVALAAVRSWGQDAKLGVSIAMHATWRTLAPSATRALRQLADLNHPFRKLRLIEPVMATAHSPTSIVTVDMPWCVPLRTVNFLAGDDRADAVLDSCGEILDVDRQPLIFSDDQFDLIVDMRRYLGQPTHVDQSPVVVVLQGVRGDGRAWGFVTAVRPRPCFLVDYAKVPMDRAVNVAVAHLREAALRDAVVLCANLDELLAKMENAGRTSERMELTQCLRSANIPLLITASEHGRGIDDLADGRTMIRLRWPLGDAAVRKTLWLEHFRVLRFASQSKVPLHQCSPAELDLIATRYALGPGGIASAARSAVMLSLQRRAGCDVEEYDDAARPPSPDFSQIVTGIHNTIADNLAGLASRIVVTQTWHDLVLSPELAEDVYGLVARARHANLVLNRWGFGSKLARGTGTAALFSGPPGTGKTMVAGLIARELELELYQVDLSNIISKWVGETEKQLSRLFDAAEAGHALLLFDEADSLFAKRSAEVKSATDRYANLEVNYLLQRVESFGGFVILTTNLDTSMDPALRRRLAAHIVFAAPETAERLALWKSMLVTGFDQHGAPRAPLAEDIEWDVLAETYRDMTGANIRNVAIAAAFIAADEGAPAIAAKHVERAARREYRSMGRVLSRSS